MVNLPDHKFVFLGESGTGKSALYKRMGPRSIFPEVYYATRGLEFSVHNVELEGKNIQKRILFNQTSCEDLVVHKSLCQWLMEKATGVFVVYDVSDKKSLAQIGRWFDLLNKFAPIPVVLVENKTDLNNKEVLDNDGERLATKYKASFVRTSAKLNLGCKEALQTLLVEAEEFQKEKERMESERHRQEYETMQRNPIVGLPLKGRDDEVEQSRRINRMGELLDELDTPVVELQSRGHPGLIRGPDSRDGSKENTDQRSKSAYPSSKRPSDPIPSFAHQRPSYAYEPEKSQPQTPVFPTNDYEIRNAQYPHEQQTLGRFAPQSRAYEAWAGGQQNSLPSSVDPYRPSVDVNAANVQSNGNQYPLQRSPSEKALAQQNQQVIYKPGTGVPQGQPNPQDQGYQYQNGNNEQQFFYSQGRPITSQGPFVQQQINQNTANAMNQTHQQQVATQVQRGQTFARAPQNHFSRGSTSPTRTVTQGPGRGLVVGNIQAPVYSNVHFTTAIQAQLQAQQQGLQAQQQGRYYQQR